MSDQARTVLFLHVSAGGYGADRQLHLLATGLDEARYRPLVVLEDRGVLATRLEEAGVEVVVSPLAVLRRSLLRGRSLAATARLANRNRQELGELARQRRVAIVHSNTSLILSGQAVAEQANAVHVQHMREIYHGLAGPAGAALWPLLRRRLARADALICVSHAVAAQFQGDETVFVLHDAVTRSHATPERDVARRALGLDGESFVVAVVGRISDWKGQRMLLRALAEQPLAEIGAVGLIAGDAAPGQQHFERELATLRAQLRLGERVRLIGFREDVETVFAAADAVALPATHADAFPNSALEAGLAGLPIVATRTGGQLEIVRDGVTGRLVPPGDAGALAAVLREFVDDREAARRLGAAARAAVQASFVPARLLEGVQDVYDRAVRARANVRPTAWLLPCKELPVSQPAAPQLRLARIAAWLRELGYEPVVFPAARIPSPGFLLQALRGRPSLILTNAAAYAPALAGIKRLRGERVLVVADVMGLHSLEVDQASHRGWMRPLVRRLWVGLERMLLRSADLALAVNDRHAELIRHRYGATGVHTLRDGAESELMALSPVDRRSLGLPADAVAVGYVGSLVYSRLEPLFTAWSGLAADGARDSLCLVIVGDGPDLERYRRLAAAEGWLGRSVFLPGALPRERALAALRACDIAYSDCWTAAGFPAKVYEYMALGMPIVTERTPQAAEVLEEGRDALLFGTPDELGNEIRRLAREPELRELLGANARRTFLAGHTLEHRRREFVALVGNHV